MRKTAILEIEEKGVGWTLLLEGLAENSILGSGYVAGNILDDARAVTDQLSEQLDRFRSGGLRIALLLPRKIARIIPLKIPAKDKETLSKMMKFEVPRQFPLPEDKLIYDYRIEGKDGNLFLITLCGIKRDDFDIWYGPLAAHGLAPDMVSLATFGWSDGEGKRTHIELSDGGMEFTLLEGNRPLYSRWKAGESSYLPGSAGKGDMIAKEIEQARLTSGIGNMDEHLQKISLAGKDAQQTARELALIPGLQSSEVATPQEENDDGNRLSKRIGVAGMESRGFNLLPDEYAPPFWSGERAKIGMAVAGLLILFVVWGVSILSAQKGEIADLRAELETLRSEATEAELMVIKSDEMEAHFKGYAAFDSGQEFNLALLDSLTSLLPKDTYLTDIEMRGNSFVVSGISSDSSALVNILEGSKQFSGVKMIGAVRAAINNKEKFKIGMELQ